MSNIVLTKESSKSEIRQYFEAILEVSKLNEQFPINLDDVWPLVYAEKGKAVRALKENFIEGIDYTFINACKSMFAQNGKQDSNKKWGGNNKVDYHLTVSCLEYFIARKVRPVFEVYRQVFHKVANGGVQQFKTPQTYLEALRELVVQVEKNERLQLELQKADEQYDALEERNSRLTRQLTVSNQRNDELKGENSWRKEVNIKLKNENIDIKIDNRQLKIELDKAAPKVEFYDDVAVSDGVMDMKDVAGVLNIKGVGRNNLFKILRDCKVLLRDNRPRQKYIDLGYFDVELIPYCTASGKKETYAKPVVHPKGVDFLRKVVKRHLNVR